MQNKQLESIVESLFTIIPILRRDLMRFEMDEADKDLSPSHLHILFLLEDLGVQPMSEICRRMQINKSNLTPLVQKLIDRKLVQRISDAKDRRLVKAELTSSGSDFLDKIKGAMAADLKSKVEGLGAEELQRLSSSLADVKNVLMKLI